MGLNIGQAVSLLKEGNKLAREGWNGEEMFIYYVPPSTFNVDRPPLLGIYDMGRLIKYEGHIDMKTAQGTCVPFLFSQSDILSEDWKTVASISEGEE